MMLVRLALQISDSRFKLPNLLLLRLWLFFAQSHFAGLLLNATLQLLDLVDLVGGHPDRGLDTLSRLEDLANLRFALVNVGKFVLVRSHKWLVETLVLLLELLQVVYVDDWVAELVEIALNVIELVLAEGDLLHLLQLGGFVFTGLNVKPGIIITVTVIHLY